MLAYSSDFFCFLYKKYCTSINLVVTGYQVADYPLEREKYFLNSISKYIRDEFPKVSMQVPKKVDLDHFDDVVRFRKSYQNMLKSNIPVPGIKKLSPAFIRSLIWKLISNPGQKHYYQQIDHILENNSHQCLFIHLIECCFPQICHKSHSQSHICYTT